MPHLDGFVLAAGDEPGTVPVVFDAPHSALVDLHLLQGFVLLI